MEKVDWAKVTKGSKVRVKFNFDNIDYVGYFHSYNPVLDVVWVESGSYVRSMYSEHVSLLELKQEYSCLRADGIPRDCDCCEGYDSRVCYPIATQYKELSKLANFTEFEEWPLFHDDKNPEYACIRCGYKTTNKDIEVCPGCCGIVRKAFSNRLENLLK